MIDISRLYYGSLKPSNKRPVVVWNTTRECGLRCIHCYSSSKDDEPSEELTTEEGKDLIRDLADFGSPAILFSGGEPLTRSDIRELIIHARSLGMKAVLSTNGTAITKELAGRLKDAGISYVGISIDGLKKTHDAFRRVKGAFDSAMRGIKNCRAAGIKTGLRFTMSKSNVNDIPYIFGLIKEEDIPRVCFYHLAYTGRGKDLIGDDLSREETRRAVDLIIDLTKEAFDDGYKKEVLTVANHIDGVYLYLRMKRENPNRARDIFSFLKARGGKSSGDGIGCVSWDGTVYADQFLRSHAFGNVRRTPFSRIWTGRSHQLLNKLKNKRLYVRGRCANCKYLDLCGGNLRARTEVAAGDFWAADANCYLTDEEIGLR